ncbi:MAG: hypothetical protein E7675_04855 [Ruminococcaceae bacterium]|nr:hypothetical protein [Oscillospiraceae bacterium]
MSKKKTNADKLNILVAILETVFIIAFIGAIISLIALIAGESPLPLIICLTLSLTSFIYASILGILVDIYDNIQKMEKSNDVFFNIIHNSLKNKTDNSNDNNN